MIGKIFQSKLHCYFLAIIMTIRIYSESETISNIFKHSFHIIIYDYINDIKLINWSEICKRFLAV